MSQRAARTRRTTAIALLALVPTGVLVLAEQPAGAAPTVTYYVDAAADAGNTDCTSDARCRTVGKAVTKALAGSDTDDVLISIGPGDYVESGGIALTTQTTLHSLAIEGAGAGVTRISPGELSTPVMTVQGLRVEDDLAISGVTLHGSTGLAAPAGFPGGAGTGILNVTAKLLRVSHTEIRDLVGGTGGAGPTDPTSLQPQGTHGSVGGPGTGILSIGHLELSDSVVDTVTGGNGGQGQDNPNALGTVGGIGGQATGVAVADLPGDGIDGARLLVSNSTVANLTGGVGGAGGAGMLLASAGGAGGQAIGVAGQDTTSAGSIDVRRSTVRAVAGGAGGGPSFRGAGGAGIGIGAERAVLSVLTSTVSGVSGGVAGSQNSPGGDAAGIATDNVAFGTSLPLTEAATTVTSTTVAGISGGAAVTGGGAAGQGFAIQSKNNPLLLAGALLAVPGATGCTSTAPVTGTGYNVVSDDTCGPLPGNRVIANIADALEPLAAGHGVTATHELTALAPSDPRTAVAVTSGICAEPDQRGLPRPGIGAPQACAAGAYEPQAPLAGPTQPPATPPGTPGSGTPLPPDVPPAPPGASIVVQHPGERTTRGTGGADYIVVGCGTVEGGGGNDVVVYSPTVAAQSPCTGSAAPPLVVHGGTGHDDLTGGPGDDVLVGGSGHDTLRGGAGNDRLRGDSGNDHLYGGPGSDDIDPGSGTDRIERD